VKKILILGGTGMLGHTLFSYLSAHKELDVYATSRITDGLAKWFPAHLAAKIRPMVDADNFDTVIRAVAAIQPDIIINCIGLIKQLKMANDPLTAITVNSQLPHRVSLVCRAADARMIHISTDCVFDGKKGNYVESDMSSATDLYGRTKFLGEVDYPHCVTLRTSVIGHELKGSFGLLEWFLAQEGKVRGFTKAIYSGFPSVEIARIIHEYVIPARNLHGVYHVSSEPISKYDLLKLISKRYGKKIEIESYSDFSIDRSLNSSRFRKEVGYSPPSWEELVDKMYLDFVNSPCHRTTKALES